MLTEKAKKQEALLQDYISKEKEFLKLQEDYAKLKSDLLVMEGNLAEERKKKGELQNDIQKSGIDYSQLLNEHEKLTNALSLCAQTLKSSLNVC